MKHLTASNRDARLPRTASELRALCAGWPQAVVRHAVAAVVDEPDAALIAAWLMDPDAPPEEPPLPPKAVSAIAGELQAQRQ